MILTPCYVCIIWCDSNQFFFSLALLKLVGADRELYVMVCCIPDCICTGLSFLGSSLVRSELGEYTIIIIRRALGTVEGTMPS